MAAASHLHLDDVTCPAAEGARRLGATLRVPASHPILAGHFPGAPLVPGVLLLEAVRLACERALARSLVLAEVADVRFVRPVAVDESVVLTAEVACTGTQVDVDGQWLGAAGRIATFRLKLLPGA